MEQKEQQHQTSKQGYDMHSDQAKMAYLLQRLKIFKNDYFFTFANGYLNLTSVSIVKTGHRLYFSYPREQTGQLLLCKLVYAAKELPLLVTTYTSLFVFLSLSLSNTAHT